MLVCLLALGVDSWVRRPLELRLQGEEARYEQLRTARIRRRVSRKPGAPASADPVADLRRLVVSCLEESPLVDVQLDVHPAPQPLAASARIVAQGSFDQDLRLIGSLLRPGVVLGRVRLSPATQAVHLEVEVSSLRNP